MLSEFFTGIYLPFVDFRILCQFLFYCPPLSWPCPILYFIKYPIIISPFKSIVGGDWLYGQRLLIPCVALALMHIADLSIESVL